MNLFGFLGKKKDTAHFLESGQEALQSGRLDEAEKNFAKALELAETKKDYTNMGVSTFNLGVVAERQGKIAIAENHFSKAFRYHQDMDEWEAAADCLLRLGIVCFKQRRLGEATQIFGTAQKYYQDESENHPGISQALVWLAKSCMEEKQFAMSEKHARNAVASTESQRGTDDISLAAMWTLVARCCVAQNKTDEAETAFKTALAIYDKDQSNGNDQFLDRCGCLHAYGQLLVKQNKSAEAKEVLQQASKICEEVPGYLEEAELATDLSKLS